MNIYLISQTENNDLDTYDSAVVVAPDEATALIMHPNGQNSELDKYLAQSWVKPEHVKVQLIGTAIGEDRRVVCASFNAG